MKILIIYTGGTIGMKQNPKTGSLSPFDFTQVENEVPELGKFGFELDTISFPPIDSSDVNPEFWVRICKVIEQNYYLYDGFVVLHGTDTMAYSASALSFMLENLSKPVIFTGSQLPIGMLRTDGKENLITAIEIAAAQVEGRPIVPEVCIYFQNKLLRGNRTTKFSAEHFNAFFSFNYPALAEAGVHLKYYPNYIRPYSENALNIHTQLSCDLGVLTLYPGLSENNARQILTSSNNRAIVLRTYGSGNAFTAKWFVDLLKESIDRGMLIVNVTQCVSGSVAMDKYENGRVLEKIGVLSGYDITFEASICKLFYLLGKYTENKTVTSKMLQAISGEITI